MVPTRLVQRLWRPDAYTYPNSETHAHTYAKPDPEAKPDPNARSYAEQWLTQTSADGLLGGLQQWSDLLDHCPGADDL